jgi:PAS domain-containing protein
MSEVNLHRLKDRLAGAPSAQELEVALEEIQALWDELHRQADYLALERDRNAVLFERAPFACLITDVLGIVSEANLAARALLDVPSAYLIGKPLAIFIAEAERESFRMRLATTAREPGRPVEHWRSLLKSPSGRPSEVQIDLRATQVPGGHLLFWFLREVK